MGDFNFALLPIMVIGGVAELASTLYLVISLPAVIIWKIYRKITKGIPLTK